jgi:hypothetical protein
MTFGILFIGLALAPKTQAADTELDSVIIPLDQIWGIGLRPLRSLEPDLYVRRDTQEKIKKYSTPEGIEELKQKTAQSLVTPIERALLELPIGKRAMPYNGFAVHGRDREALPHIHRVLVQGEKPKNSFPIDTELSIVFFTHPTGNGIRLDRVERKGSSITIRYMLISHGRLVVASKLALIPCGKLPAGEYQVEMVRSKCKEKRFNQRDFPPVESGMEDHIICRPFSFIVTDTH